MAESIRVRVRFGGSLAALAGTSQTELTLGEPLPLREIARRAGVSPQSVMLYSVNGTVQRADFAPADGDEVLLVPAVAGGGPGLGRPFERRAPPARGFRTQEGFRFVP